MEQRDIQLGKVVYELSRIYTGKLAPADLLAAQLAAQYGENSSFDGNCPKAV